MHHDVAGPVVLLNGEKLGAVSEVDELKKWVSNPTFSRQVMVRVEPHHHLQPMNGHGGIRKFALIGRGILAFPRPQISVGIIFFTDIQKKRKIAIVPERAILPLKNSRAFAAGAGRG